MQAGGLFVVARTLCAVIFTLAAGNAAANSAAAVADKVVANVGGVDVALSAPPGQSLGAVPLEPLHVLHGVSGDGLEALAVFVAPETARFFASRGQTLPAQGLISTLIITEKELASRHVDERSLRDVLVDELDQQRQLAAFMADRRFGSQASPITLPRPRLLGVEDFLILEGHERLLPQSGRRIAYCVEAFLALRNRPVLASSCVTKPDVSRQDMYALETSVGAWARSLLADNASSRSAAPAPARRAGGEVKTDAGKAPSAAINLRLAAEHRRTDVLIASTLLSAQLPAGLRTDLERSNDRFGRNVASMCGSVRKPVLGYQCELVAFDRRLRAFDRSTPSSIAPLLSAESVEPPPLPST